MSVNYSFYEVPNLQSENTGTTFQARITPKGTIKTKELCTLIGERSSLSPADVKAALDSLNFCFNYFLAQGYNIELDNLGIFSLGLKSEKKKQDKEKNVFDVKIKGIHFRPSVELKEQIKGFKLEHKAKKNNKQYSRSERLDRIMRHVREQGYINRRTAEELNNASRYIADNDLKELVSLEKLRSIGIKSGRNYIIESSHTFE